MAAPISISKSNYYITGGMYALGNEKLLKKLLGKDGYQKLFEFLVGKIYKVIKKTSGLKKNKWFNNFQENPTNENLKKILKSENLTKIKKGESVLNEISAKVFFEVISEIDSGRELSDILNENKWVKVLYDFYRDEMPDYLDSYLWTFKPTWLKAKKDFIGEYPFLIKGYEYYLEDKEKMSQRELCEHIEDVVINKVLNVRIDYQKYDIFFKQMEYSLKMNLENEFKITYLKLCSEPLLSK